MQNEQNPASIADALIQQFISATPRFTNPQDRLRYWIDVANQPQQYIPNPTKVKRRRAQAIQNIRRLVERYPVIAKQMLCEAPVSKEAA